MPPLSPRAQEILDAIERDVTGGAVVASEQAPARPTRERPAPPRTGRELDPVHLLESVDEVVSQADHARRRLDELTEGLRGAEKEFDGCPAPSTGVSNGHAPSSVPPGLAGTTPSSDATTASAGTTPSPDATAPPADTTAPSGQHRDPARPVAPEAPAAPDAGSAKDAPARGSIDLHQHLLPGIDDGPRTLEGSLELARATVAAGTTTVVATPHVSWDYPATSADVIAREVALLEDALAVAGIPLRVLAGAEIAITRAVDLPDDELARLHLGGGPYLLVECSFSAGAAGVEGMLDSLLDRGNRIVLAHPERCPVFQQDHALMARLAGRGVLSQVTAGSLAGRFGRPVQDVTFAFAHDGLIDAVASDAHSAERRPPSMQAELTENGWAEQAEWLTSLAPRAILDGAPLPAKPEMPQRPRTGLRRLLGH